jgi:hypothetical protein
MKAFTKLRTEAHADMLARKQKLLNRSNDAYSKGDLPTMRKAHSLAMKQDSRTRAKYPDEERKRVMSGANSDYTSGKRYTGDSVEYPEDTNVIGEGMPVSVVKNKDNRNKGKSSEIGLGEEQVEEGILDFMSGSSAKPKSKLSLSAMREISRKMDAKNKMPKVSRASNDSENPNNGFRFVRAEENEIEEANKMKGKDPCWTGYHMIGTKPKGGKQVPNCVPEEVEQVTEKFWDEEGEMIRSQMKGIIDKAQQICDMLEDDDNLEAWVQSEVTTASDAITCVYDHLKYGTDVMEETIAEEKPGLYANIHAKQRRIKNGSGEHMRKPGSKGAPTAQAFKDSAKTAKEEVEHTDESRQVYYINSHKNQDPAVAQAKRIRNKMSKPPMINGPRTTLSMGEATSARNRLVLALDREKKKREDHEAAQAAREAREAAAKTPPEPQEKIKEGIASLISKNIKRVTATKPTPQQKADIRLNK